MLHSLLFAADAGLEDAFRALADEIRGLRLALTDQMHTQNLNMELVIQSLRRRSPPRAAGGAARDDQAGVASRGLGSVPIPGTVDFGTPVASDMSSLATAGASDGSNAPTNASVAAALGEASVNSTVVSSSSGRAAPTDTDLVAEAASLISHS